MSALKFQTKIIQGVTEKNGFILAGNNSAHQLQIKFLGICKIELPFVPPLF
jgi:hypothetical protein